MSHMSHSFMSVHIICIGVRGMKTDRHVYEMWHISSHTNNHTHTPTFKFCGWGTCLITAQEASDSAEKEKKTLDNSDIYNLPHLSKAAKAESKRVIT